MPLIPGIITMWQFLCTVRKWFYLHTFSSTAHFKLFQNPYKTVFGDIIFGHAKQQNTPILFQLWSKRFYIEWFICFPITGKVCSFSPVNNFNNRSVAVAWSLGRRWLLSPNGEKAAGWFLSVKNVQFVFAQRISSDGIRRRQYLYSRVPWGYLRKQWAMPQLFLRPVWTQSKHGNPPSPRWAKESWMMDSHHTGIPVSGQSLSGFLPPSGHSLVALFPCAQQIARQSQ